MPNHVLSKIAVTNPDVIKALQSANAKIDINSARKTKLFCLKFLMNLAVWFRI